MKHLNIIKAINWTALFSKEAGLLIKQLIMLIGYNRYTYLLFYKFSIFAKFWKQKLIGRYLLKVF